MGAAESEGEGVAPACGEALALVLLATMLPAARSMVMGAVLVTHPSCALHRALLLLGGHTAPLPRGTPRNRLSVMLLARPAHPMDTPHTLLRGHSTRRAGGRSPAKAKAMRALVSAPPLSKKVSFRPSTTLLQA